MSMRTIDTDEPVALGISPEKVLFVAAKMREVSVNMPDTEADPSNEAVGDDDSDMLSTPADDGTQTELESFLEGLNEEEQVNLVALAWIGRGDYSRSDWGDVLADAENAKNDHAPGYLLGIPLLAEYLIEGLSMLGYSREEYDYDHL